ncbi:hypothetical protein EG328_004776 [Venturia inaequalis]|uniref:Uncharacterized protein n=1 Tax=Venturia inaequalis TaxID=5025 RepID=A0A8H3VFJ8_VENIN|nr:hypothetical protein EG328_004776 [Venturia inaequalis]
MTNMQSQSTRPNSEHPRKKKRKNKKAMKRAKDRQPSHSLPVISTSQPEADSSNPPESLLNTSDEDGGQLELDQAFHIFDEEEDGRNEGKHYIAVDDCPNSGDNYHWMLHTFEIKINYHWVNVTNLIQIGNSGRRSEGTFSRKTEVVRPRLGDVLSKMRRERNAASEETLAKSRGTKAYMSWKIKQAKATGAREREEEYEISREPDSIVYNFPSSPSSNHETPPVEDATTSERLTPISGHNESRIKRKETAHPESSRKRRKAASVLSLAEEDINTMEEPTVAAHQDNNSQSEAQRGHKSRIIRMSPVVKITRKAPSSDSLQRKDDLVKVPFLFANPARNASSENNLAIGQASRAVSDNQEPRSPSTIVHSSVPIIGDAVENADTLEEAADVLEVGSTLLKESNSPDSGRRDSARDATLLPYSAIQVPVTIDSGSHTTRLPASFQKSCGRFKQGRNYAGPHAQPGFDSHAEQTHPEPVASPTNDARHGLLRLERDLISSMNLQASQPLQDQILTPIKPPTTKTAPIFLDSDSDDDVEIISMKITEPDPKQSRSGLPPPPSTKNGLANKSRRPPKSDPVVPPRTQQIFTSPAKTLSQGRKKGPPGLRELPAHTRRPGITPTIPAKTPSQTGKDGKQGQSGVEVLLSATKFTPTLVRRLLRTRPAPILVDDNLEEELTSPESSPGPGIAQMQIEIGPKETKFVRQEPLPISISSDEDSNEDSPSRPNKRSVSELRLEYRSRMPDRSQKATATRPLPSQHGRLQTSQPIREQTSRRDTMEEQEIWPEESRGELAQAAIDYLNAVPQNKQLPMDITEMLNFLGEQPEFNKLCSQIKQSGRDLSKPAFASAILSKLEPPVIEEPSSEIVDNRAEPSLRSKISTSVKHSPNISRKMTPGRVVDTPPSSTLPKKSWNPKTKSGVHTEFPRGAAIRGPLMSPEGISLMSPAPTSSQNTPLEHVPKRRNLVEVASSRNATSIPSNSGVIIIDATPPNSPNTPRLTSSQASHQQTRKDEVLSHIAERLLLHEGPDMLSKLIKLTTAKIVEEEYNLFNAEKAVAEREAEKATNSKAVRPPDFSVYKRLADWANREDETPGKRTAPTFEWTWSYSRVMDSSRKIRGRSTSVTLPSEQIAQAPSQGQTLLLTPRKIRGRSTTPEMWLNSRPGRDRADQDMHAKSVNDDGDSDGSSDTFFDAEEKLSTETL